MEKFERLQVWEKAHAWVLRLYQLTRDFPREEMFGITSQLRRAAVSVPANVVEGYNRVGAKDKLRFYGIALASLEESRYFLLLAEDLGFARTGDLRAAAEEIGKMLHGLINTTKRRLGSET